MKKIILRAISWLLVILWMAVIFFPSSQNKQESNSTADGFITGLCRGIYPGFVDKTEAEQAKIVDNLRWFVRKCAHFAEFAILGMLCTAALNTHELDLLIRNISALGISVVYACSDEIHQAFVPGRACRFTDILIDTAGAAFGIAFAHFVIWFFTKRKKMLKQK